MSRSAIVNVSLTATVQVDDCEDYRDVERALRGVRPQDLDDLEVTDWTEIVWTDTAEVEG